jgi:hypothetical protein
LVIRISNRYSNLNDNTSNISNNTSDAIANSNTVNSINNYIQPSIITDIESTASADMRAVSSNNHDTINITSDIDTNTTITVNTSVMNITEDINVLCSYLHLLSTHLHVLEQSIFIAMQPFPILLLCFYSLFLFDIEGDQKGAIAGTYFVIATFLLPFIVYIIVEIVMTKWLGWNIHKLNSNHERRNKDNNINSNISNITNSNLNSDTIRDTDIELSSVNSVGGNRSMIWNGDINNKHSDSTSSSSSSRRSSSSGTNTHKNDTAVRVVSTTGGMTTVVLSPLILAWKLVTDGE